MTCKSQSHSFISAKRCYATLKIVYDVGSEITAQSKYVKLDDIFPPQNTRSLKIDQQPTEIFCRFLPDDFDDKDSSRKRRCSTWA